MKLSQALAAAAARLAAAGIEEARREARLLAAHLLGLPASQLLDGGQEIDADALDRLVLRRAEREPFAHIAGRRGFWTLDLAVSPATLVPRPDSETLIEAALSAFPARGAVRRILDLGTGSGCLLLAALSEFPASFGVGCDLVPEAACLAAQNAAQAGLAGRAVFLAADWDRAISGRFDLVLCNPPYIRSADMHALMPEVRLYEPARALDGGESGLAAYQRLIPALPGLLTPGGAAILELGAGQADAVMALAAQAGFARRQLRQDLGGVARALTLQL